MRYILACLLMALTSLVFGQSINQQKINKLSSDALPKALEEFKNLLSIPNLGSSKSDVEKNRVWCRQAYESMGFTVAEIQTATVPILVASYQAGKPKTVIFYTQIDGQPVTPSSWHQTNPYLPVMKAQVDGQWQEQPWTTQPFHDDWRIFARSASDSKGPAIMLLQALRIMREQKLKPEFNIKVVMDFEEEQGSPELATAVTLNRELLAADYCVIMDGVRSVRNVPTLTFGARGITTMTLKIFGSLHDAHSGQFGNYVPNPVFAAAWLLAAMKDESGRVLIPGFYDGVTLSDEEKRILNEVPDDPAELGAGLGIARPEAVGATYQESLQYPSLNIRGIKAADVGAQRRTVIPAEVTIEMDMRLVPETPSLRQVNLLKAFIEQHGYHLVDNQPTAEERKRYHKLASFTFEEGSLPFRTSYSDPMAAWLSLALVRATGINPIKMRTTGGSQPISPFITTLGVPAIAVRIPDPESNIHASDENIRMGNFREGIATCLSILTQPIR
ncbi:MAG TPA: M20/M25/M40 family metallo-hydrolase [Cyclobacteriaceae bacterium]|nr:M20/M25/M40 family metallo-hydrolase [Cyclobacteriaceae bacterium]